MQNAYDSHQFTQLMGKVSWLPAVVVQVLFGVQLPRFASVGAISEFQSVASHPVS
jgi:hypothetical protein